MSKYDAIKGINTNAIDHQVKDINQKDDSLRLDNKLKYIHNTEIKQLAQWVIPMANEKVH